MQFPIIYINSFFFFSKGLNGISGLPGPIGPKGEKVEYTFH